ncbi:hypothetical protein Clacol_003670 [Clathrus columnatus]|uniref:Tethering factor for nuclear proteasome STS1 n=1 Tax=Clathrus columnatus TaxID=1419009 RepID=A0AAV5A7G4_9AGAM|nr:hypothetical protein Clacol_003670 [Clathrus columnatus]
MANIYLPTLPQPHHLEFPRNVNHSTSSLGFGFGLSSSQSSTFSPSPLFPYNHQQVPRPQKRRLEADEEGSPRSDDAMDRSPTPERPKRGPLKRLRVDESSKENLKELQEHKANRVTAVNSDVDIGVLLASLPQQSLLPLLMSLLREQPNLKPILLSLIPRPTLQIALQVLVEASKALRDAYPYSTPQSRVHSEPDSQHGPGSYTRQVSHSSVMEPSSVMRESYVLSRLRPHITEFITTCFSYLPYFSFLPSSPSGNQSMSAARPHPTETFTFLSTLMSHIFSQPQLTQNELLNQLMPRLLQEWKAWLDRIDTVVNRAGGMFSAEIALTWDRNLDDFAEKHVGMKEIRHSWIDKVGWLVGKRLIVNMDEDEGL